MSARRAPLRVWMAAALMIAAASSAHAFSTGITTNSFPVPAQGCRFCHGGGSVPTVVLECVDCGAPPVVDPASVHEFKLTVVEIGLQDHAGLNVSALLGTLATGGGFAANTQAIAGAGGRLEITHTAPKPAVGGVTEYSFLWTAPAAPAAATLSAWGNAVNFDSNTSGDAASPVTLDVSVGGSLPTPTATPDLSASPTPTATPVASCPSVADPACTAGFARGLLVMKASVPGKEKLIAKLLRGPALAQADMGNPLDAAQGGSGTAYSLCVYDGADNLAGGVLVDRAGDLCEGKPCWKPIGHAPNDPRGPGKGYRYRDGTLAAGGVLKILYKGGDAGSSRALVIGKGPALPTGIPAALQSTTEVSVQLRSSDAQCLSVTLSQISAQDASLFKAK